MSDNGREAREELRGLLPDPEQGFAITGFECGASGASREGDCATVEVFEKGQGAVVSPSGSAKKYSCATSGPALRRSSRSWTRISK